jgi:predicted CoA-binding protein
MSDSITATDDRVLIRRLLRTCRTIAVVGISSHPFKDSHIVAHHLQREGYEVVPVNPNATSILGLQAYPSLGALPDDIAARVDLVVIFRPSREVPEVVDQALARLPNLKAIWTQKGIVHDGAAQRARGAGIAVVQDRCIRTQHLGYKFSARTGDAITAESGDVPAT